jgi:hypothetical protein
MGEADPDPTPAITRRAVLQRVSEACRRLRVPVSTAVRALLTAHRYIAFTSWELFLRSSQTVQVAAICFLSCKVGREGRSIVVCVSV